MNKTFSDYGIEIDPSKTGECYTSCPQCSNQRKKKYAKCLSVNINLGVWKCHHCGWAGGLSGRENKSWKPKPPPVKVTYDATVSEELKQDMMRYFQPRGISWETVAAAKVTCARVFYPSINDELLSLQFPFYFKGEPVNIKSRPLDRTKKAFMQVAGALKVFCGMETIAAETDTAVIVEGEIDKLSVQEVGFLECLSVPDGAPAPSAKSFDKKFSFIDNCLESLAHIKQWILAVDNDDPGRLLQAELIRRLGAEKCRVVQWPEGSKDPNDVLVQYGPDALRDLLYEARYVQIDGIVSQIDLINDLAVLYEHGLSRGCSTGWVAVDQFYTVKPCQLTVLTGVPSSGKSEWLDALVVNLMDEYGWKFAVFSPENWPPPRHLSKLIAKKSGFPMQPGPSVRLAWEEAMQEVLWFNDRLWFIAPGDEVTLDTVLRLALLLVRRHGINGLIIDPYNELEHKRPAGVSETEYISGFLSTLRRFARNNGVHVWLVAHPAKMQRNKDGEYDAPSLYDISGSAHFRNKADNGITVHRPNVSDEERLTEIHIQKVRFRDVGKPGLAELRWDVRSGRYFGT